MPSFLDSVRQLLSTRLLIRSGICNWVGVVRSRPARMKTSLRSKTALKRLEDCGGKQGRMTPAAL